MAVNTKHHSRFWERQRTKLFAFSLYAGLTVVMTWPLAAQLGTRIPGLVGDSYVHLWTFEFVKGALLAGESPYFTDMLFYPEGTTLVFHNIAWVNIAIWLALQAIIGSVAAYTIMFMGVLAFNGFAVFLLARELFNSEKAAFLSGLVCAFWPFILSRQDHPNLIFIGWIALALLYLRRALVNGRTQDALLAALFIILTGFTRWQVLIMAAPLIGLYVLYQIINDKSTRHTHALKLLALIGIVSLLGLTPLMAPMVYTQMTREFPEDLFVDEEVFVTDLVGFIVPSRYHPLWGQQGFDWSWGLAGNVNYVPFLGFTTLGLAIVGAIGAWRKALFWIIAALFYGILTLGPQLHINGQPTIPLPYALIEDFFLVQTIRHPERLNVILSIPMAILAGFGVTVLQQRPRLQRYETWVVAGLSLLIVAEYIITFPTLSMSTPSWYETVAAEPGEFAILDIPMHMRRMYDKQYMIYQLTHGRPLVEGHVSRPPREAFDFIESVPLLKYSREQKEPPDEVMAVSRQLQQLDEAGVKYLVLHKQFLHDSQELAWREWLTVAPTYEDEDLIVYETATAVIGEDILITHPLISSADGEAAVGLIRPTVVPEQTVQGGWVEVRTRWGSSTAVDQPYNACLELQNSAGDSYTAVCEPFPAPMQPNDVIRANYLFQTNPRWQPGQYTLNIVLYDADGNIVGVPAYLSDFTLEGIARQFDPPTPDNAVNVTWQDRIALPGYDLTLADDQVNLTFYWQALAEMETGYKFFLHVVDADTGELAAQTDFVSQDWSYPTNWWAVGEYVPDPVSLSLADLPEGVYELWLGIYHPDSGERLRLADTDGRLSANDAVLLETVNR